MEREKLEKLLIEKVNREYDQYMEGLKKSSAETIVKNSFQTCIKQKVENVLQNCYFLNDNQLKKLCDSKNILHEIYDDYSNSDYTNFDDIKDSIVYVANMLIEKSRERGR